MAASFKSGSDDKIDLCSIEGHGLFGCRRRPHRNDTEVFAFVEDFPRRNSKNETENRWLGFKDGANLLVEILWFELWCRGRVYTEFDVISAEGGDAFLDGFARNALGAIVRHR
nr:hypothetical protein [Granulicella sp. L46]